jgi:hypothetical protein
MQMAIPEVMVLTDIEKTPLYAFDIKPQAVGIGPGGKQRKKHCMNS